MFTVKLTTQMKCDEKPSDSTLCKTDDLKLAFFVADSYFQNVKKRYDLCSVRVVIFDSKEKIKPVYDQFRIFPNDFSEKYLNTELPEVNSNII